MKRHLQLLMLLAAFLVPWATNAQTTVTIGTGTVTSNTNPIGTYYNYSITEQLYTVDEIGMAGNITSISFYYMGTAAKDLPITVYMENVSATDLSSGGISLANATEVFSGTLSVPATAGWVSITLGTPFPYDGTSNLLIGIIKDYLYYFTGQTWQGTTTPTTMARYTQNDNNAYTTGTTPGSEQSNRPNIQLTITPSSGPTCERPADLTVSNITTTGATFSWTSTVGNYVFEYKAASADTWTTLPLTSNTTTLTNLQPGTSYDARVKAVCEGGIESAYRTANFMTGYGVPFSESFPTSSVPTNWNRYTGLLSEILGGTSTLASTSSGWSFGTFNSVLDNHTRVNIYGTSCKYWLVTPTISIGNNVQLTFDLALTAYSGTVPAPSTSGTDDKFVVLITTDGGTTWTVLRQWDNAGSSYVYNNITCSATGEIVAIDLSSYAGQSIAVAFYGESTVSNADNNVHIDNVSIDYIPSCLAPDDLTATNVTTNTAYMTWTGGSGTFNVEYKLASADTWTRAVSNVGWNYMLVNLTPATTYDVRVQSVCTGEESSWRTASFTTACDAITSFPWSENFESYADGNFSHPCWVNEHITGAGGQIFKIYTYSQGGNSTHQLQLPDMNIGTQTMLRLPEMTLNGNYQFVLDVYRSSSTYNTSYAEEGIRVFASANGSLDSATEITFIPRQYAVSSTLIPAEEADGWYTYELPIPITTGTCYIILRGESQYCTSTYMDNFVVELAPACPTPTQLAVNYTGGNSAQVSWNSDATLWNIKVNGTVTYGLTANPTTITGLDYGTTYTIQVQANCGGDISEWTSPVTFTTDLCDTTNMCALTITITDAYGDGGGQIQVVDTVTNTVLGTYTNSGYSTTYTLNVCNGRTLNFVFASTDSWSYENGWVITDINEEVVSSHEGCTSSGACDAPTNGVVATYTVDCAVTTCRRPTAVAATEIGSRSVQLGWTENGEATSWVVAYAPAGDTVFTEVAATTNPYTLTGLNPETAYTVKVRPVCSDQLIRWSAPISFTTDVACPAPTSLAVTPGPTVADVNWNGNANNYTLQYTQVPTGTISTGDSIVLSYDDGSYVSGIGNSTAANWTWGVMYPASMYMGGNLTKVSVFETSSFNDSTYTVKIYSGGTTAPDSLLASQVVTPMGSDGFHEITLTTPVTIDFGQNLWIVVEAYGTYVMSSCNSTNPNNTWVYDNGSWGLLGDLVSSLAGRGWMIRGQINPFDLDALTWTTVNNATAPASLTGLTAETDYITRVKALCGGQDGESAWEASLFTTLESNPIPMDVVVTPAATRAAISWRGYSDSYKVYYRTAEAENVVFSEGFESDIDTTLWKIYTVGEAPQTNGWYTYNPESGLSYSAHGGSMVASAWSWNGSAYNADNWLVTPQVTLGGTLKYWERTAAGWPDHYEVIVSTTGNTVADFANGTVIRARAIAANTGEWNEVTLDLSAFSGQAGYIAFHHADTDANYLLIDDIRVIDSITPAGAWVEVPTTATNATITGLTPETTYEYKVTGIVNNVENAGTDIAQFTTDTQAFCPAPVITMGEFQNRTASFSWTCPGDSVFVTLLNQNGQQVWGQFFGPNDTAVNNMYFPEAQYPFGYVYIYAATVCGDIADSNLSDWTIDGFAVTCDTTDQCTVSYVLHGQNGWQGGVLDVYDTVSGVTVSSLTLPAGLDTHTTTYQLCTDRVYRVAFRDGTGAGQSSFSNVAFEIVGPFGNTYFSASNPDTGTLGYFTHSCTAEPECWPMPLVIGNENSTTTSYSYPVNNYYKYTLSETIIDQAEIGGAMPINGIRYYFNYASPMTSKTNCTIYLQPTTKTAFSSSSDLEMLSDNAVMVYTGALNCSQGWNTFTFDTPYQYDGTSNLMVIVDDNSGSYNSSSHTFRTSSCTGYKTLYWYSDSENPDPTNGTFSGSKSYLQSRVVMALVTCDTATCHAPVVAEATTVGANNATVAWTNSNAAAYSVTLMSGSSVVSYNTTVDTTYTFTGLTANSDYSVEIRALCSATDSSTAITANFHTECDMLATLPYTYGFEGATTGSSSNAVFIVECWKRLNNATGSYKYPYVSSSTYHTGTRSLYWYSSTSTTASYGNYQIAVLPGVGGNYTMSGIRLKFWSKVTTATYRPVFYVGVMTDPNDYTTFVPTDTIAVNTEGNTNYAEYIANLTGYTGTGRYVAIAAQRPATSAWYAYMDDITLEVAPTCVEPAGVTVDNITTNSAVVSWTGTANAYTVAYGTGTNPDSMATVSATGNSTTLTGLMPNTAYNVYVKAVCSATDQSPWTNATTFRTNCATFTTPYTWTFEDMPVSTAPLCWTKVGNGTTNVLSSTTNSHNSTQYLRFSGSTSNLIVLPEINGTLSDLRMRLWTRPESTGNSSCGTFSVGYVTDASDASTFVALATYSYNDFTDYDEKTVAFTSAPTGARMALRHNPTSTSWYWYVDDVTVEEIPSCEAPSIVDVTYAPYNNGEGDYAATVSWENTGAQSYEVCWIEPSQTRIISNGNDTVHAFVIHPEEASYVKVRAICGAGDTSAWSDSVRLYYGYCEPTPTSVDGQGVTSVAFGGMTNTTSHSGNTAAYVNNRAMVGTVQAGTTATVDITYATGYDYGTIIWVDWNKNYTFDGNEVVYAGTSADTNPTTLNASFVIPATQDTGDYVMRIVGADSYFDSYVGSIAAAATANPCFTALYSVAEDYTLHVSPAAAILDSTVFVVSVNDTTMGTVLPNVGTMVYHWGDNVNFTAVPNTGYNFGYWLLSYGNLTDTLTVNPVTGTIDSTDANQTYYLTAVFVPQPDSLTLVLAVNDATMGSTTPAPGTYRYGEYDVINVTATPAAGYVFDYWVINIAGLATDTNYNATITDTVLPTYVTLTINATAHFSACPAVAFPFAEGFESGALSNCWSIDGPGTWIVGTGDYTLSTGAHTGTYNVKTNHGTTGNVTKLITPAIDMTGVATAELKFWHLQRSWTGDQDELRVYYRTSATDTWHQLAAYTDNITAYTEEIIPLTNLSSTFQVAFEFTDGYGYGLALDDISIDLPPSCMAVTALTATPTDSSVVLNWSDANTGATYTVYDMSDSTVIATGLTATTYTVTGLTANTLYTFGVVANCSATDASQFTSVAVRTNCATFTTPYTWTFEDMPVSAAPLCWTKVGNGTTNVMSSDSYAHNSTKYLRFSGSTSNLILLPEINGTLSDLQMRLWTRPESTSNSSCGTFSVGYVTDIADPTTFVALATYSYNDFTDYDEKTVAFASAPAGARMALRHTPTSSSWYWYVDDVTVEEIPSCMPVTSVAVTGVTLNSVSLSWNSVAGAASYIVYNMADTSVVAATVTDTFYTVTGLTAETNYTFGVKSRCSATDVTPIFATVDAFTGYCQPNPTSVDGQGITSVAFGSLTNAAARPSGAGYRNYSNLSGMVATGSPVTVDIVYATGYSYGTIIWVDWNNSLTFESNEVVYVGTSTEANPDTLSCTFNLPADQALGSYRMRILGADSYFDSYTGSIAAAAGANPCASYTWGVAEDYTLTLVAPSVCPNVDGFTVTGVTNNSVSLSWNTVTGATYTLYNGTNVVATGITDTVYTVTGLTANTDYTFGVVANCSATEASAYPATVSARTLCDNVNIPFVETFEATSATRNCWTLDAPSTANAISFEPFDGHTAMRFSSYVTATDYNQYAYSPVFNTPSTGDSLHVRVRYATYGTSDSLWFGVRLANMSDFVWMPTAFTTMGQNDIAYLEANLPINTVQLAVHYYGNYSYYAWIDSVEVSVYTPGCQTTYGFDTVVACDSTVWNGNTYTQGGTYSATLTNAAGCDSVVTLNLTINNSVTVADTASAIDSYLWHGNTYTVSGDYVDSLTTLAGCDSICTLHLTVSYSALVDIDSVTACDSYTWRGTTYTASTVATDTVHNASGADSIYMLILTVNYSQLVNDTVTACDSYLWHGVTYTADATAADTLTTVAGCDSICTLTLTVNHSTTGTDLLTGCDSILWNDTWYTASTIVYDSLETTEGCDSIVAVTLLVNQSVTTTETVTSCDSYEWNGTVYTASTLDTLVFAAFNGCDSNVVLDLTINYSSETIDTVSAIDNYTWRGTLYDRTGLYSDTLTGFNGCDSILTLDLTISGYSADVIDTVEACDSAFWHGRTYYASTVDRDTIGTDVYMLLLTINHSTYDTVSVTARFQYEWHDSIYTQSGIYNYYGQTAAGCDHVETLILTIDTTVEVYYSVAVVVANTEGLLNVGGTVEGEGSYLAGTEVTLTATPDSGYLFNGWYTRAATGFGGELLESDSIYTITLDEDVVLVAMFERIGSNSALLTVAVDTALGQVLFNGMEVPYNIYRGTLGDEVTLTAVAINNSTFLGWVNAVGDTLSRDEVYTVTLDQTTMSLTAAFRAYIGIDDVVASEVEILAQPSGVLVRGAAQQEIMVFDVVGRLMGRVSTATDEQYIRLPQTGVYLVKVADLPAKRVLVRE